MSAPTANQLENCAYWNLNESEIAAANAITKGARDRAYWLRRADRLSAQAADLFVQVIDLRRVGQ